MDLKGKGPISTVQLEIQAVTLLLIAEPDHRNAKSVRQYFHNAFVKKTWNCLWTIHVYFKYGNRRSSRHGSSSKLFNITRNSTSS